MASSKRANQPPVRIRRAAGRRDLLCARPIRDARPVDRRGFPSATNQDRLCRFRQFRAGLDVTDTDSSTANPTRLTIRGRPGRESTRPNGRTVVSAWIWSRYCRYSRGRSLTPWGSFPWNTFLTDCRSSSPPRVITLYTRALAVCEKNPEVVRVGHKRAGPEPYGRGQPTGVGGVDCASSSPVRSWPAQQKGFR
jgi:hypothetical protein